MGRYQRSAKIDANQPEIVGGIRILLPYPLPTWNRLLAMEPFKRKRLRNWIHASILQLSAIENASTIQTVYLLRQRWMELYGPEYYQMIRPKKLDRSNLKVKNARKMNVSGRKY